MDCRALIHGITSVHLPSYITINYFDFDLDFHAPSPVLCLTLRTQLTVSEFSRWYARLVSCLTSLTQLCHISEITNLAAQSLTMQVYRKHPRLFETKIDLFTTSSSVPMSCP